MLVGCDGDYGGSARQMKYARERYRLRSLRDKGLRKRVGGPLDHYERDGKGLGQDTPEGRNRPEGVNPQSGAEQEHSYRCLMKNNSGSSASWKWHFVRLFSIDSLDPRIERL